MNRIIFGIRRRIVCHVLAGLSALIIAVPLTFMWLDNVPPLSITHTAMFPSVVRAGDSVSITWTATETRACDGIIHRRFVDSAGVIFEIAPVPSIYRGTLGPNKTFSREVRIPSGMAPGPAVYGGVRRYWCNPLQRALQGILGAEIVLPSPIIKFTVIP